MPNEFYDSSGAPATSSSLSSATMRGEFDLIEAGFAKFPTLSGNGFKIVAVNSGGTALEAITTTGTGSGVRATSPTLVTPILGVAAATSINKNAFTAPASGCTWTLVDGKTFTCSNTLSFSGTDSSAVNFGTGGTVAYVANKLSVFAATTSAELAGVISDETGSGSLVFATSPTLVTPTLGVAIATSINRMSITAPASASTLAVADGKTFTATATLTLAGTDGSTLNVGTGGTLGTAAYTAASAYQPVDADLTAIGALASAANKLPYATGAQTWALADFTAAARSLLDDADAATMIATLGAFANAGIVAWTPTISASGGGVGSYTVQVGRYLDIGKLTIATAYVGFDINTLSGSLSISLPATSENVTNSYVMGLCTYWGGFATSMTRIGGFAPPNSSTFALHKMTAAAASSSTALLNTDCDASQEFMFVFAYFKP